MKCKRRGCTNLLKGQWGIASVYDEMRAKKYKKTYTQPHHEMWCLECFEVYEADKYTYVMIAPKAFDKVRNTKRVPRLDEAGTPVVLPAKKRRAESPIDTALPPWASKQIKKPKRGDADEAEQSSEQSAA